MTAGYFTKHFDTPQQATAAARHHAWLAEHARPLRQPALTVVGLTSLTYERIAGRHAAPPDLLRLAALLGNAHGAAWTSDLRSARLNAPHRFRDGTAFGDYVSPRQKALHRRLDQGYLPDANAMDTMLTLLRKTAEGPSTFYKDSNPRNFLITETGSIYVVDTDDLTLAPMAYDLAKLILTLTLTYGPLPDDDADAALLAYNEAAGRHDPRLGTTSGGRLNDFLTLHAALTAPYIGRNGYQHGWLTNRSRR